MLQNRNCYGNCYAVGTAIHRTCEGVERRRDMSPASEPNNLQAESICSSKRSLEVPAAALILHLWGTESFPPQQHIPTLFDGRSQQDGCRWPRSHPCASSGCVKECTGMRPTELRVYHALNKCARRAACMPILYILPCPQAHSFWYGTHAEWLRGMTLSASVQRCQNYCQQPA